MSIKLVLDSTADVVQDVKNRVTVVPLTILFEEKEYVDGIDIDRKAFYERLIESDILPTTSQATPSAFLPIFEKAKKEGDTLIVLTLASTLSGTYQSAMIAAEEYDNVYVVDSKSVSIGSGILAELALKLISDGYSAEDIVKRLEKERDNIQVIALLNTLEYLKKGGRISTAVALAGGLLAIKPVLSLKNGAIEMLGKARGSKQGNNLLVQEIEKAGGIDFKKPLLLGYTGISNELLLKYMDDSSFLWKGKTEALRYTQIGSVVGTHSGPGAIAVAFFKN